MTFVFKTIATTGLLALGLGATAADAMPTSMPMSDAAIASRGVAAPKIEQARLVCRYRRCYRTGGYRYGYARPYGYYRPYYYGPHIGIGLGGVGLGIY